LLANLGEVAQNPKEKNRVKPLFRSLIWKHPDRSVSRIVLKGDPKYFPKSKIVSSK